jgi:MFS family permease
VTAVPHGGAPRHTGWSGTATKRKHVAVLALCEVLGMSLWFAGAAVLPAVKADHAIGTLQAAALSSAVAFGFVVGTLLSAVLGLADRIPSKRLFALAATAGALVNAAGATVDPASVAFVALRFAVGLSCAGIYPVGIRMAATWASTDMGVLIGLLVGAVTVGSASAFLLAAVGAADWRLVLLAASLLALGAAALISLFEEGPRLRQAVQFRAAEVADAWRVRALRLANLGYYGHMWELYAFWAWVGAFLEASIRQSASTQAAPLWAGLGAFAAIGAGAFGCLAGGALADRYGRTTVAIGAMLASGSCALLAGAMFGGPPPLLVAFCMVWGIAAIADSAQFSASTVELSPPDRVGTMVTVQVCVGFLVTMASIHLLPLIAGAIGWRWTFAALSIGPFLGAWAMYRLRRLPEAGRLAGGRR